MFCNYVKRSEKGADLSLALWPNVIVWDRIKDKHYETKFRKLNYTILRNGKFRSNEESFVPHGINVHMPVVTRWSEISIDKKEINKILKLVINKSKVIRNHSEGEFELLNIDIEAKSPGIEWGGQIGMIYYVTGTYKGKRKSHTAESYEKFLDSELLLKLELHLSRYQALSLMEMYGK